MAFSFYLNELIDPIQICRIKNKDDRYKLYPPNKILKKKTVVIKNYYN